MSYLTIVDVSKYYNNQPVLKHISMEMQEGDIVSLLGPSGCGKTTLLRIIAGLTGADEGRILLKGRGIDAIPPHGRRFGLMFQEFALFPHKNVLDNIAFGLQMQGLSHHESMQRIGEMLDLVGLNGFEQRNVADLSGGERQRVALARSLAPQPQLLMLDEPLGALDRTLRQRLMLDLIRILRQVNVTTIFVTHDQAEAFAMADTIAVMDSGHIEQIASPEALYNHPANVRVARFLGFENLLQATVVGTNKVETPLGILPAATHACPVGSKVMVLIKPDGALLKNGVGNAGNDSFLIEGSVIDYIFLGYCYRLLLESREGCKFTFDLPNDTPPIAPGTFSQLAVKHSALAVIHSDPPMLSS